MPCVSRSQVSGLRVHATGGGCPVTGQFRCCGAGVMRLVAAVRGSFAVSIRPARTRVPDQHFAIWRMSDLDAAGSSAELAAGDGFVLAAGAGDRGGAGVGLRAFSIGERDRSSPVSANNRAPVRAPSPGKLVMIPASGCLAQPAASASMPRLRPAFFGGARSWPGLRLASAAGVGAAGRRRPHRGLYPSAPVNNLSLCGTAHLCRGEEGNQSGLKSQRDGALWMRSPAGPRVAIAGFLLFLTRRIEVALRSGISLSHRPSRNG